MLQYTIDHVVWAGPPLSQAVETFAGLGFAPVAGGKHGSGATENALIPFPDGSYVELLSRVPGGGVSPLWEEPLAGGAGWCDWCLGVTDIDATAREMQAQKFSLRGPFAMHRDRPDNQPRAEWKLAFVRQESAGGALPFLIEDTAPRANRVPQVPDNSPYSGIHQVIVAVPDVDEWRVWFARYFGLSELPVVARLDVAQSLGIKGLFVELAPLPILLAQPTQDGALADRVRRYGPMLCGVLLRGGESRWLATDVERGLVIGSVACDTENQTANTSIGTSLPMSAATSHDNSAVLLAKSWFDYR